MAVKKNSSEAGKPAKIRREEKRLSGIFAEIDANMLQILSPLIQNSAYITVTIDELQSIINKTGYVVKYDNGGGQSGLKESVHVKMHKDYSKLQKENLKCLAGYVPRARQKDTLLAAMRKS
ncbi:MAG: hypothetical protein FWH07_04445 [Oscillospiraceae bacterium]|nr:hypothetical protein [Oscillospiraceae bacterium]